MAERLVNSFTVNRPIDEAWAVLTDVERIAPCLPGAQLQEIEGDIFRGIVKVKLGAITPQFKGQAQFRERDDAEHRAVLKAEGRDTGGRGNASADITATAQSLSPTSTQVDVTTDLHITGRVAQFGRGIIGDVSKKLMDQFADNLNTMLDEEAVPDGGDSAATDARPAGAGSPSTGDAGSEREAAGATATEPPAPGTATSGTAPGAAQPGGPTPTPATPTVRKIDGPAIEPVDLAGLAGPAVLKRLLPVIGVLVAGWLLLRRRLG